MTSASLSPAIALVCLPDDYTEADLPSLLGDLDPVVVGWGHQDLRARTDCLPSGEMTLNLVIISKMEEMNNI